ncbi:unnamed protein product [Dovyalis caffra]|uniref:MTHFR SAM-binding regulatory domain-containing protein n=1 Tax=Dovyalis caffra TaxID=77055 RepID=A0AAV1RPK2_9ROSI|nr:unnamed protein product [Dovyalis caffra]
MFVRYCGTQFISSAMLIKANRPKSYLSRTTGWDQNPHGRWGDSHNPSYGALSDYQFFRPRASGKKLVQEWVVPLKSVEDINEDKVKETFDLGSAKNLRLGRARRYVYQKAYLEFFCSKDKLNALVDKCKAFPFVTYMAVNEAGSWISNVALTDVNAVTWGVFQAKEIIQPTVVDPTSFSVWKDEAFEIWSRGWAFLYPEDDPSRTLLQKVLLNDIDLLNPTSELEKRKHKLMQLVQFPNSFFVDAKLSKANQELFYIMSPPYFQVSLKLRQCDHLTVAICISNRGALSGRRASYASEGARILTPKVGSHTGSRWDQGGFLS